MAILQALISYLGKSAGKALNAIFGWAVLALFGTVSPKEQTKLTVVVAAAAAWPILVVGAIVPKIALVIVAFVPLGKSVPSLLAAPGVDRAGAVGAVVVGTVIAKRGSTDHMPEPAWKRLLRGFPVTLRARLRLLPHDGDRADPADRHRDPPARAGAAPAVMDKGVTGAVDGGACVRAGAERDRAAAAKPPWYQTAPSKILLKIGGGPSPRWPASTSSTGRATSWT